MGTPFNRRQHFRPYRQGRSHIGGLEQIPDLVLGDLAPGETAPTFISIAEAVQRFLETWPPTTGDNRPEVDGDDDRPGTGVSR